MRLFPLRARASEDGNLEGAEMTESRLVFQDMKVAKVDINKQLRAEAPRLTFPYQRSDVRNAKNLREFENPYSAWTR